MTGVKKNISANALLRDETYSYGIRTRLTIYKNGFKIESRGKSSSYYWDDVKNVRVNWKHEVWNVFGHWHYLTLKFNIVNGDNLWSKWTGVALYYDHSRRKIEKLLNAILSCGVEVKKY